MNLLKDKHNIVTKLTNNYFEDSEDTGIKIFNFFENFIISDNILVHSDFLSNYIYYKKTNYPTWSLLFKETLELKIKNYLSQYIKKIRNNIRISNKTNSIKLETINNIIKSFYYKLTKLDSMLYHFKCKKEFNHNYKKEWGNSNIIELGINILCNTLLVDNSINYILNIAITKEMNKDVFLFSKFIKIFSQYNFDYNIYVKIIDKIIFDNKPIFDIKIDLIIQKVYDFKNNVDYLNICSKRYNHILFDKKLNFNYNLDLILNYITDIFIDILKNLTINEILCFINTYSNKIRNIIILKPKLYEITIDNIEFNSFKDFINFIDSFINIFHSTDNINNFPYENYLVIYCSCHFKELLTDDIKYCCEKINKNIINNKNKFNSVFYKLFNLDIYKKYLDIFIKYFEQNTIERLIYSSNFIENTIKINEEVLSLLVQYINISYLNNLVCIISDYKKSFDFNKIKDIFTLIVTKDIWDININSGNITKELILQDTCLNKDNTGLNEDNHLLFSKILINQNKIFNGSNKNKNLIFYPHIGSVNINFKGKKQNTNITMLPIQMLFLEIFNNKFKLPITFVLKLINKKLKMYDDNTIDNVISSFIHSDLVLEEKNNFVLNLNYNKDKEINLIDIFHDISNFEVVKEEKILNEIIHSREKILSTVFNHIIKKNKRINKIDLIEEAVKIIKQFAILPELVDNTLDIMKKKEYIYTDDSYYCKKIDF